MRSDEHYQKKPFDLLGKRLKAVREKRKESLGEVSGAVEIDIDALTQIEQGEHRPSEEVLLLLISHFDIKDEDATRLWELAAYDDKKMKTIPSDSDQQPTTFAFPMDVRIVYTDLLHIMVNNYGVVMNFMQNAGPSGQPLAVARVGMSKEHARSVLEALQKTLDQAEQTNHTPKLLPSPKTKKQKSDTN